MTSKKLLHYLEIALRIKIIGTAVLSTFDIIRLHLDFESPSLCLECACFCYRDHTVLLSMD